jgi:hypothetical protein
MILRKNVAHIFIIMLCCYAGCHYVKCLGTNIVVGRVAEFDISPGIGLYVLLSLVRSCHDQPSFLSLHIRNFNFMK